ncbi:MAG: hypothetical protein PVI11_03395 [Candidatus Aminicenantes bacterium]|jgi:hypothetical protein
MEEQRDDDRDRILHHKSAKNFYSLVVRRTQKQGAELLETCFRSARKVNDRPQQDGLAEDQDVGFDRDRMESADEDRFL